MALLEARMPGVADHVVVRVPTSLALPRRPVHFPVGLATVPVAPVSVPVTVPLVTLTW
jgi:hypothetical protein